MTAHTIDERVAEALAGYEAVIERGLVSFLEVGDALQAIRSERLYLLSHSTFAEYCQDRWGFSDSRARQLVAAAKTVGVVTTGGLAAPTSEAQARELTRVPAAAREDVWRETLERTGGKPTAEAIRETAGTTTPPEPEPVKPTPSIERRRRDIIKTARRTAEALVPAFRADVVAIVSASDFGEPSLVTTEMVAELRAALAVLERQL